MVGKGLLEIPTYGGFEGLEWNGYGKAGVYGF